jgi:S1-C subfamily serine protease
MQQALLTSCLVMTASASAEDSEQIFRQAQSYTVQIRSAVTLPFAEDKKKSSVGAGFVVDAERGWIMTNAHVAARSPSRVMVAFRGGDYHEASKVYVDPYLDLAILKLADEQRANVTAASLACDKLPPVGHLVGAFGHPWKLWYTGTRGIVSGVTARFGDEMLQTDAAINHGNSGGPLISLETGKIVGINTSRLDKKDDENTNFALPMKYACRVLALLQEGHDPSPPKLSTVFLAQLEDRDRLVVAKTYLGADTLPLKAGDVITGIVDVPERIRSEAQLIHALRGRLGSISLNVQREGRPVVVRGRLQPESHVTARKGIYASGILFGYTAYRDDPELNLDRAIMVHYVELGSPGRDEEFEKWDLLVSVDGKGVSSLDDLYKVLVSIESQGAQAFLVVRRVSDRDDQVFDYLGRNVPMSDVRLVTGHATPRVAIR